MQHLCLSSRRHPQLTATRTATPTLTNTPTRTATPTLTSTPTRTATPSSVVSCYGPFTLYNIGPNVDECRTDQGTGSHYSNANTTIINSNITGDADGYILYDDGACTTTSNFIDRHNTAGVIFGTNGSGVITSRGCGAQTLTFL